MYYQILGKNVDPKAPGYRGVERYGPSYDENQQEDSTYNRAWRELIDRNERFDSPQDALRLVDRLDQDGLRFDVIGIEPMRIVEPPVGRRLLGYDVASNARESLLSWGIRWDRDRKALLPVGPILNLVEAHFQPNLNDAGLFRSLSTASSFRDVLAALQALVPGIWEAPGRYHPEVLGIVAVRLANFL